MKLFEKGAIVFFILGKGIVEGTIDRNNGVNTGTYNVLFEKEGDSYKDIFDHSRLFKTEELLEDELKENIRKEKQIQIDGAEHTKQSALGSIKYCNREIQRYQDNIENQERHKLNYEEIIKECDTLLTLKIETK